MGATLIDHLWQSSLFALCAWALTLFLNKNGAGVRHAVWLAASIKFLIPFSSLALLGEFLKPAGVQELTALSPGDIATLLVSPAAAVISANPERAFWSYVVCSVWILGFLVLAARWYVRWHRTRVIVRAAVSTPIVAPIPVKISHALREPGVVGILRPVLLLPTDIESRLTAQQLQGILKHELCHVRRHDNLTAAIHTLVEAVFWFHPLVWWIGTRMLDERERACDEAVVQSGNDPHVYAQGILKVCQSYLASDSTCVSGASGADLKTRLEAIMKKHDVTELSGGMKFVLGLLAFAAVATPVLVGLTAPESARAADVKTNPSSQSPKQVGKIELLAGKRVKLKYENVDVRSLIKALAEAARVNVLVSDQVSGSVTVDLVEIPWDQALDVVLHAKGLVKHEKDGILFVEPASGSKEG